MDCPCLTAPANGGITLNTIRSAASYTCDAGFALTGDMTRTCQSGGAWTGSDPTCDGKVLSNNGG